MLETKNLTKKFGDFTALHNLNLKVNSGEIFCLLGANGAGKSTTINLFLNFLKPSSGQALIDGLDVCQYPLETKSRFTYIPENLRLYPQLTGLENLDFFYGLSHTQNQGLPNTGKVSKDQLIEVLNEAGLPSEFLHRRVSSYSKGMRQKVGIALAMVKNAQVLLLDEPTSGLDPQASNEFSELLIRMKSKGVAILMATHDLWRARDTGSHIGIMKQGHLLESFEATTISHSDLESLYLSHMYRHKTPIREE
ncbi:ABC transporter ATP-binding protein [Membranihabitans marinus]|uniref:ABC transporter ATP-binding protein n=1 Tax=Membranihabitans marinus TaxID=1227546 RepID=UPI001F2C3F5B|nr:ABC transporter ATP-binding protein [Membranihabitans marinus]